DGAGTIVDENDLVAGERQLVTAARARAVDRGQEFQPAVGGRVLEAVARFVGEFAEVDLPRMAGGAQHENVGARAEDPLARAGDDHGPHFRALEADAVYGVVELDVDAQIVAVELELVAG